MRLRVLGRAAASIVLDWRPVATEVNGAGFDATDRRFLRAGGVSALVLVAGYFATFPLYAMVGGPPPPAAEASLAHYAAHLPGWWGICALMVFTDFLYITAWLALHRALRGAAPSLSVLSLVCAFLFVGLDLAVTWTSHAALFVLAEAYGAATAADRPAIVAAAGYPAALMASPIPALYAILVPSLGPFLAGLAMSRAGFGRTGAVLAGLIGGTGIAAFVGPMVSPSLVSLNVPNALLVMVWFAYVGIRLYRLGGT